MRTPSFRARSQANPRSLTSMPQSAQGVPFAIGTGSGSRAQPPVQAARTSTIVVRARRSGLMTLSPNHREEHLLQRRAVHLEGANRDAGLAQRFQPAKTATVRAVQ